LLLVLVLAAALVWTLDARQIREPIGTSFKFPEGLPDGAILTFYFWHISDGSWFFHGPESVNINFYDRDVVDVDEVYDINAHLRIDREFYYPVVSNTYVNGHWLEEKKDRQLLDEDPASDGWWRVDVIKERDNEVCHRFHLCFLNAQVDAFLLLFHLCALLCLVVELIL
ncbi:hypothetical protein PENTCL1PPCAC_8725, partial [Pristionchus entomophagus]